MHITLTDEQRKIVKEAVRWYRHSSEQVFQIAGNPGTGKSVVLGAINQELNLSMGRVAPMAYVGAAAIQMRLKGLINAVAVYLLFEATLKTIKPFVRKRFNLN